YNRGNALAQAGELEAAIAAYDQTLASQPDHEDARFNRELVQRMLEEQQSSAENSEGEGEDGGNPQDQNQPQYGDEGQQPQDDQQQGDQPEEPPEPEASEQDQSQSDDQAEPGETDEGESSGDERQEALEQWLRRVPDDPGGLLRRKFQYETNQRLRSGDYSGRETEKIW
ncbi:MAG: tetratricopeptide repeat protein, partial [Pseudomonadales bacterium]|nr:tetratricopeptide repeat protein [Pseudomonadales bacterium]